MITRRQFLKGMFGAATLPWMPSVFVGSERLTGVPNRSQVLDSKHPLYGQSFLATECFANGKFYYEAHALDSLIVENGNLQGSVVWTALQALTVLNRSYLFPNYKTVTAFSPWLGEVPSITFDTGPDRYLRTADRLHFSLNVSLS